MRIEMKAGNDRRTTEIIEGKGLKEMERRVEVTEGCLKRQVSGFVAFGLIRYSLV